MVKLDLDKYYDKETKTFTYPDDTPDPDPKGLGWFIFNKMKECLKSIAQIDAETGTEDFYESYLDRIIRTTLKMKSLGIRQGDIIALCSYNHLNNPVPLFASIFLGAQLAHLDPSISVEDTKQLINMIKPKMVFVSSGSEKLIEDAVNANNLEVTIISFDGTFGYADFDDFISFKCDVDNFKPHIPENMDETLFIMFSSGTSGLPKGICLGNKMIFAAANSIIPFKVGLSYSPPCWLQQMFITIICALKGQTRLVCRKFVPNLTWEYLIQYQDIPKISPSNMKYIMIGGSMVPWDCIEKFRATFPNAKVISFYGQTELVSVLDAVHPGAYNKKHCIGVPLPGGSYRIVNPDTEEILGKNQVGELRVKTKWCMSGYYKQDASTAWDSNGYFKTGDLMYYDDEYCFFIVDRIKEMFEYRCWQIIPSKLEKILYGHPEVLNAVVVGLPNREDDHHAIALVIPVQGAKVTPEELKKYVDDQVDDKNRLRAGVKFVKELPMTPSNKIKRRDVVKMLLNNEF